MKTKPAAVKHEAQAFAGRRTLENPQGEIRRANYDHLIDLVFAHPDRVDIRPEIYRKYYEAVGVKIWR